MIIIYVWNFNQKKMNLDIISPYDCEFKLILKLLLARLKVEGEWLDSEKASRESCLLWSE